MVVVNSENEMRLSTKTYATSSLKKPPGVRARSLPRHVSHTRDLSASQ